jgi:hypothetical protein
MTHFHMDVWTPDAIGGLDTLYVKLVDFGANGVYDWPSPIDDVEGELGYDQATLSTGTWISLDIPLANFAGAGMTTKAHFAQMILSGQLSTVFVDNVYFYEVAASEPSTSAPTPTHHVDSVFSIFSDAYTNTEFDTWSSQYDNADFAYFAIGSDSMIQYTNMVFTIAEYTSSGTADLSTMTHFHMDVWTPNTIGGTDTLYVKLVDFGANGVYDWPSPIDDVEGELGYDQATLSTGTWISFDIPLADFATAGMTTKAHFAQMILSGQLSTVFVDNVYFHK